MSELEPLRMCHQLSDFPCARFFLVPALSVLAATQLSAQVPLQETRTASEATSGDETVIVRGRRLGELEFDIRDFVRDFVGEVAAPAQSRGLARWHGSVCVGVSNLEQNAAQYLADRISYQATVVGLAVGEPGCQPDVVVIFATNARELASYLVENHRGAFRPSASVGSMSRSRSALEEFALSDNAVRWWHLSTPVGALDGQRATHLPSVDGFQNYPWVRVSGPSRLHSGIIDRLSSVIIIVDSTKLAGTTWQQLGDYLAVISLAQIELNADPRAFDSILNLFSNPAAYSGLTDWDQSYLHALYSINQERIPELQINSLVHKIVRQENGGSPR